MRFFLEVLYLYLLIERSKLRSFVNLTFQVIRLHEEFFLPGEVILEQGNVVDQLYFVCHGVLV